MTCDPGGTAGLFPDAGEIRGAVDGVSGDDGWFIIFVLIEDLLVLRGCQIVPGDQCRTAGLLPDAIKIRRIADTKPLYIDQPIALFVKVVESGLVLCSGEPVVEFGWRETGLLPEAA